MIALAIAAAPAVAAEPIASFKTSLIEASIPLGEVATSGLVQGEPSGESLQIETRDGQQQTVELSPATVYTKPGTEEPSLADVRPGDFIGVFGSLAGATATATQVEIIPPQVGGHPDLTTSFSLEAPGSPEVARNVIFNAPTGFFGNPRVATECTASDFALDQCPPDSQVGLIAIHASYEGNPDYLLGTAPLYVTVPQNGETARFAFVVPILGIPIAIPAAVRTTSDYGLRFTVQDLTQAAPLAAAKLTFWGFPFDETHNSERFPKGSPGNPAGCPGEEGTGCIAKPTTANLPNEPLTDNPTTCTGEEPSATLAVQSYQDPGHLSEETASYAPIEDCEAETFEPFLRASPTTTATDSASGLNLDLAAPQFETKAASPSEIRAVTVTLPPGLTINPDAADGQTACSEAEAGFDSEAPANCPDSSKIGTFQIATPALSGPLERALYLGEPKPEDPYRLFMIASGFGINAKLVGSVKPNPGTGQPTVSFPSLPQAPFAEFSLHLFAGERALLATPTACSVYAVSARFTPWNGTLAPQTSDQHFGLASGPHGGECPGQLRPFAPTLEAGSSNPTAGAHSTFALNLERADGDQFLGHLGFTMPPGLTANLNGVTYCSDAAITAAALKSGRGEGQSPSCPAASLIGTSDVAAGPGSHPFHVTGNVYFAGPFQGAPLSLAVIIPALAGPYDYGTVVVRVAINVDPLDAHVIAASDVIPEIIGGIPLRIRQIRVSIDRPNFMINPTNCSEFHITSEGVGDQGTAVSFTSPFIAVNCSTLPFSPRMTIAQLGGHAATARGKDPSLQIDLATNPGEANVHSVSVTLPSAFEIDQRHLGNLCSEGELTKDQCAGRQAIGIATTETPLLEKPLEGPVYAVSGGGGLPRLAFILGGQVTLVPRAESSAVAGGRLRTIVPVIPDAPIGHFRFTLFGGHQGYITNTRSLCSAPAVSSVSFEAQNGKSTTKQVRTKTACKSPKRKRHHRRR